MMKKEELKIKLQELGVNENVYSLNDGTMSEGIGVKNDYSLMNRMRTNIFTKDSSRNCKLKTIQMNKTHVF
ncbi:MAG: hypothetical protein EAZ70_08400 [Runella slithyformis]|nr:MAG: hypothetical protein EAZ70_08400 [Runella slithyformis]